jgi:hypothetical protein
MLAPFSAPSIRRASSLLRPHQFGDPLLMPPNESLHFLKGNGAIVVGVHRFEDSLVCRLKLLQCEFPVAVSIHQTENYSHHRGCHAAAAHLLHRGSVTCSYALAARGVYPTRLEIEGRFVASLMFLPSLLAIANEVIE